MCFVVLIVLFGDAERIIDANKLRICISILGFLVCSVWLLVRCLLRPDTTIRIESILVRSVRLFVFVCVAKAFNNWV